MDPLTHEAIKVFWIGSYDNTDMVDAMVAVAEAKLKLRVPRLQERLDSGEIPIEVYRATVADIVHRVLRNPEGLQQWSETGGPYSNSATLAQNSDRLWVSDSDIRDLLPPRASRARNFQLGFQGWQIP